MCGPSECICGRCFTSHGQGHTLVNQVKFFKFRKLIKYSSPTFLGTSQVLCYLEQGGRLQKPSLCPKNIYEIMYDCWNSEPMDRPTFEILKFRLDNYDQPFDPYTSIYILDKDREAEQVDQPTATQDLIGDETEGGLGEDAQDDHQNRSYGPDVNMTPEPQPVVLTAAVQK